MRIRTLRNPAFLSILVVVLLLGVRIYLSYRQHQADAHAYAKANGKRGGLLVHTVFRSYRTDTANFSINGYKFSIPRNDVEVVISGRVYSREIHTGSLTLLLQYPSLSGLTHSNSACLGFKHIGFRWNVDQCENAVYVGLGGIIPVSHAQALKKFFFIDGLIKRDELKTERMKKDGNLYIYHFVIRPSDLPDTAKFYGGRTYLIPINSSLFEIMLCRHIVAKGPGDLWNGNLCAAILYSPPLPGHSRNLKIVIQFSQNYRHQARTIIFNVIHKLCGYGRPGTSVPTFCTLESRSKP